MHAIKDIYHVMGVTNGCGLSYKWFKDNFCETEEIEAKINKQSVYEIINRKALSSPVGANGLLYLPYLMVKELLTMTLTQQVPLLALGKVPIKMILQEQYLKEYLIV